MQAQWNALLASALLGTEQRKCAVVSPEVEFLATLESPDPEKEQEAWLLLVSAYAATYRRAGQTPPLAQRRQPITPAPPEIKPYCSPAVANRIIAIVNDTRTKEPLLTEVLIALTQKGRIVPPTVLPDLLAWGQRSKQRRSLLLPVVGERGQWLTSLHPDWKNALQVDPKDAAEQAEIIHNMTGQQALYKALDITDNIFSKTYSVFTGQGLSANGRLLQLVTDKISAMSRPGETYLSEYRLIEITIAVPPAILPELTDRIRKMLGEGENSWRSRLVEFMEYRQQVLEELKNE